MHKRRGRPRPPEENRSGSFYSDFVSDDTYRTEVRDQTTRDAWNSIRTPIVRRWRKYPTD